MGDLLTSFTCLLFGCSTALSAINTNVFYRFKSDLGEESDVTSGDIKGMFNSLDASRPTAMYIHGWRESCDNISATTMMSAFDCHSGYNRICVDWSTFSLADYVSAAVSTSNVGKIISKDIAALCELGFKSRIMHVVGFSLGAHIAGNLGNTLKSTSCSSLGKITALEAALPLFHPAPLRALKSNDADMTYACHSDGGVYGVKEATAVFDFFLNNGTRTQKGCVPAPGYLTLAGVKPIYRCSHDRCWQAYAEAICDSKSQIAQKCDSFSSFANYLCTDNPTVVIGLEMPTNVSGTWYYNTTMESPLGRGQDGISH